MISLSNIPTDQKPFRIEGDTKVYHYGNTLRLLQKLGKLTYGSSFFLRREDKTILYKLLIYAIGDTENCNKRGLDLSKGILLSGPIGCGKTSLMFLLNYFIEHNQKHLIKSTREINAEIHKEGMDVIQKYAKKHKTICFDDLGVEATTKYYGNDCHTMAEILLGRYELQIHQNIKTHATTNLNADELEKIYGNRVRSRLRSMFNLITFPTGTKDKRS